MKYIINISNHALSLVVRLQKTLIIQFFDNKIQVRPVWHPNHLQKKMKKFERYRLNKYENYHTSTICLPSGYNLSYKNLDKVIKIVTSIDKNES